MKHKLHITLSLVSAGLWLPVYAVMFIWFKYTGSNVESRHKKRETARANLRAARLSKPVAKTSSAGYKKSNFISGQTYSLECTHQIRARKQTGLISRGMIGKTVWCDVCNANRVVTGSIWAQH